MAERDAGLPSSTAARSLRVVVERGSAAYPKRLLALRDPPLGLEILGQLPLGSAVAIVGTRAATPYGRAIATRLGRELASLGITVVSGLARGIDAAAHEGALESGGPTVAVLPFGVTHVMPPSHAGLAERVAARGAVVAEWPRPETFWKSMFLDRNRIIAGLAQVTVVVEAGSRSGALSTARVALSLGRPCLAVPGDVDRPGSHGPHALLRAGASPCEGLPDVLEALEREETSSPASHSRGTARGSGKERTRRAATVTQPDAPDAARLLGALDTDGVDAETIAARLGWDVPRILAELLPLEWSGVVVRRPGGRWARRARAKA